MAEPNADQKIKLEQNSTSTPALGGKLLYDGYTLQWADDFNGSELNRGDWNIELQPLAG